jgi:hypothetical protein
MNTTIRSPHGTNKETARNLLDVRIILAVLWVAGMLINPSCYLEMRVDKNP